LNSYIDAAGSMNPPLTPTRIFRSSRSSSSGSSSSSPSSRNSKEKWEKVSENERKIEENAEEENPFEKVITPSISLLRY
jgi:hypothetical protein